MSEDEAKKTATCEPDQCLARIVRIQALSKMTRLVKVKLSDEEKEKEKEAQKEHGKQKEKNEKKMEEVTADNILHASVLGWKCVVKKDEFKEGDLALYISIGSVVDKEHEGTTFLQGKPIKTQLIFDHISQGLLLPLSYLARYMREEEIQALKEDDDVTAICKIQKHVPQDELDLYINDGSNIPFPSCVPKTDEQRGQNVSKIIRSLKGKQIVITTKYDGTSTTFILLANKTYPNGQFLVCGRNKCWPVLLSVEEKEQGKEEAARSRESEHYFNMAKKYDIQQKLTLLKRNIAIQGEIVGPKINCNRLKLKELEYRIFNVWDIDYRRFLVWEEVEEIAFQLGVKTVPVLFKGECTEEMASIDYLLDFANKQEYGPGTLAEGIVVKTNYGPEDLRHSFKVISNKYILKHQL